MESSSLSSFPSPSSLSSDVDANLTLSDRLRAFKISQFDPDAYVTAKCRTMNEKEIKHLCLYLVELKKASAEEMRRSVYANYAAFIRTSKEISDLEGQLISMRNLLSSQAGFVHSLAEGVRLNKLLNDDHLLEQQLQLQQQQQQREDSSHNNYSDDHRSSEFVNDLEVLLAEKRVEEVMSALESPPAWVPREAVAEHRRRLADQLVEAMSRGGCGGSELRSAAAALRRLGDGVRAHKLLLGAHERRICSDAVALRRLSGAAYAAAASKSAFSRVARAADDSLSVFSGEDEHGYTSGLVTWAVGQTEAVGARLKRHVMVSAAASGGLRAAADCVRVCLGHCALLEARGLSLSSALMRIFKPLIQQALAAGLRRIEQSSTALAAADDWSLCSGGAHHPKLSTSALKFTSMVQDLLEDIVHLESLQLDGAALEGVLKAFNSYVDLLVNALPGSIADTDTNGGGLGNKLVKPAESEAQQIALLGNAWVLADEILPRAGLRLLPKGQGRAGPEQRDWKRKLLRSVDRLRDTFCRNHALDLIFTDDGESRLSAQTYTSIDLAADEPEWFPTPIFQVLFTKLTRIAGISSDVFVGRERCSTVLLIRLLETVILWLSNDQNFWEELETGQQALGPRGLQQFYLDMEFVLLFSSQGRFLSRNMHQVIRDIIDRAVEAVEATGIDPYSVLPEGDWFAEVAQIAIKMLTGKDNYDDEEADQSTPSASSIYSHGTNFD